MNELLRTTADRAGRYLAELPERRAAPDDSALRRLADFDEPFPDGSDDPAAVIGLLDEVGSPATMATAGGRASSASSSAARCRSPWRPTGWPAPGIRTPAPSACSRRRGHARGGGAALAARCCSGCPPAPSAGFVTGATMANFSRPGGRAPRRAAGSAGWNVEADGLFGAPPITVVVGDEVHASVLKALGLLGLGRERVVSACRSTARDACAPTRCRAVAGPAIVCIQAGNVNTGAFDPVGEIVARAHAAGAWVHVDGAFGLWAAAAPARAYLYERRRRRRFLGDRRPQVAQRALRQRPGLRARA